MLSEMKLFKTLNTKKIEIINDPYSSFISAKIIENIGKESLNNRFYVIAERSKNFFFDYRNKKDKEYDLTFERELTHWSSPTTLYYFNNGKNIGIKRIRTNDGRYTSELKNFSKIGLEKIYFFKVLVKSLESKLNKKLILDETWKKITPSQE